MVDFDWYRSFVAVYRVGTVSGAAVSRFLTQPAVSQHLAALEAAVGQPLFVRTPRRMIPTEAGKELYARMAQAVDTLDQVSRGLRGPASAEPIVVRVGAALEYFHEIALERLASAPFRFRVEFGIAESLAEKLERGDLDAVIATQKIPARAIEFVQIDEEHFLLVGPPDGEQLPAEHPGEIEDRLSAHKWIGYSVEMPIIRRFWQQTFKRRPPFQPALVIPNLHAIERAVELGYGVSVLPGYLCQGALESGRVRLLWEPPAIVSNELWLAYRKVARASPEIAQLLALLSARSNGGAKSRHPSKGQVR